MVEYMREATAIGLVLAVLLGVLGITQLDTLRAGIQPEISGPLSSFVGLWPYFLVVLVLGIAVAFATAIYRRA
jgi:hypothetical protein